MREYEYVLEGHYGPQYGWEDVSHYPGTNKGKHEALADLAAYRENEPEYSFRLKTQRATDEQ